MNDRPTTILGVLHIEARLPLCDSLKAKRSILKRALHQLHERFRVAAAEVDAHDDKRSTVLAVATVSGRRRIVERQLDEVCHWFDTHHDLEVVSADVEILS